MEVLLAFDSPKKKEMFFVLVKFMRTAECLGCIQYQSKVFIPQADVDVLLAGEINYDLTYL